MKHETIIFIVFVLACLVLVGFGIVGFIRAYQDHKAKRKQRKYLRDISLTAPNGGLNRKARRKLAAINRSKDNA